MQIVESPKVRQDLIHKIMRLKFKWDRACANNKGYFGIGKYRIIYRKWEYIIIEDTENNYKRILECSPDQRCWWSFEEKEWKEFINFMGWE